VSAPARWKHRHKNDCNYNFTRVIDIVSQNLTFILNKAAVISWHDFCQWLHQQLPNVHVNKYLYNNLPKISSKVLYKKIVSWVSVTIPEATGRLGYDVESRHNVQCWQVTQLLNENSTQSSTSLNSPRWRKLSPLYVGAQVSNNQVGHFCISFLHTWC
jgi:hypothetical protein